MRRLVWPRLLYWACVSLTLVFLIFALAMGGTSTQSVTTRSASTAQSGAVAIALLGFAGVLLGKAWMDSVVASRGRAACPACSEVTQATAAHCQWCGAPLRTTRPMLEALVRPSEPRQLAEAVQKQTRLRAIEALRRTA
jgi:hypothetical protein